MPSTAPFQVDVVKDWVDYIQLAFSGAVVLIGGIWTWREHRRQRLTYPAATVTHSVLRVPLGEGKCLLRVTIGVQNTSKVLIRLGTGNSRVYQIAPVTEESKTVLRKRAATGSGSCAEIDWPMVSDLTCLSAGTEIEPGEDHDLHFDHVISDDVSTVMLYGYLTNATKASKQEIGWHVTSHHTF